MTSHALRRQLREIGESGRPASHPDRIARLRVTHPHTIEHVAIPVPIDRYTCAMHAFDLIEDDAYLDVARAAPDHVYASPRFVERLIAHGDLRALDAPRAGALVVYGDGGVVRHIGRLMSVTRVESKWGIGHLFRHDLLEVPEDYGNELRFFAAVGRDFVLGRFLAYVNDEKRDRPDVNGPITGRRRRENPMP